jgi:hypothetical protein
MDPMVEVKRSVRIGRGVMALFWCVPPCGHTSPGPATMINPTLMLFSANAHLYVGDVGVRESKEIQGKFRIRLRIN